MCNKRTFSERRAEAAIKKAAHSRNPNRKECRSYFCKECNGWHLTSNEYKNKVFKVRSSSKEQWRKLLNAS